MKLLFDQNISPKILKTLPPKFSSVYFLIFIGQMFPKAFGMTINPEISGHFPVCLMMILIVSISSSQQVRFVGLENASDMEIFQFAKKNHFTIVSFDSDFIDLNSIYGTPPKIIYLNSGNVTTKEKEYIQNRYFNLMIDRMVTTIFRHSHFVNRNSSIVNHKSESIAS